MGNYLKALELLKKGLEIIMKYYQKALDIQENVASNPLDCAATYLNLGKTYCEIKDYATTLRYYEKCLKIRQERLLKSHPSLAVVYHGMAKLYLATQQAFHIAQETLPSTHPHLLEYLETLEKFQQRA